MFNGTTLDIYNSLYLSLNCNENEGMKFYHFEDI